MAWAEGIIVKYISSAEQAYGIVGKFRNNIEKPLRLSKGQIYTEPGEGHASLIF